MKFSHFIGKLSTGKNGIAKNNDKTSVSFLPVSFLPDPFSFFVMARYSVPLPIVTVSFFKRVQSTFNYGII